MALVFACSFDGPPSTRYDATVNGAPAKPISGVAHRLGDDGADAGLDVEVDADRLERQHDVGEEDGRVDAVPPHRLEGDLGDQAGVHAGVEHGHALTDREVLRERTAGLAHVPDGRVRHRLPPRGAEEGGVVQVRVRGAHRANPRRSGGVAGHRA